MCQPGRARVSLSRGIVRNMARAAGAHLYWARRQRLPARAVCGVRPRRDRTCFAQPRHRTKTSLLRPLPPPHASVAARNAGGMQCEENNPPTKRRHPQNVGFVMDTVLPRSASAKWPVLNAMSAPFGTISAPSQVRRRPHAFDSATCLQTKVSVCACRRTQRRRHPSGETCVCVCVCVRARARARLP